MQHPARFIIAAACALVAQATGAQQVWRCGSSYSQQPCAGGAQVDTSDGRSAAQAAKSSSVAQADMKLADKMEKERLEREKNAPKALVIGPQTPVAPPKPERQVANKKKGKAATPEVFTAVAAQPAPPKKAATRKKNAT